MTILFTILIFVIILGLLVFVHELGHFLVAKKSGMKVDEFGFGFPPRLIGLQKQDGKWRIIWGHRTSVSDAATVYSVNWIPLGGFVKIVGENNDEATDPRSFVNKPFFPRLLTLLAGVLMNIVLAWVLISAGYMYGLPVATDDPSMLNASARFSDPRIAIVQVVPDSPAAKAGLQPNDVIKSVDGNIITSVPQLQQYVGEHTGQAIRFEVVSFVNNQEVRQIEVTPLTDPPEGSGPTGVALAAVGTVSYPPHIALWEGAKATIMQLFAIVYGLYQLVSSGLGLESVGGPVKIAQLTGQVARLGFTYLLQFTAFLSLNLAILNALPIPALDGGRVLFLLIEKIRGKRNNPSVEQWVNTVGFMALLLLMLVVTVRDVSSIQVVRNIIG